MVQINNYSCIKNFFTGKILVVGKQRRKNMNTLQKTALALTIVGALNWGLVGLFQFDLVATIFGGTDALFARIIYVIIAIAGIINIGILFKDLD